MEKCLRVISAQVDTRQWLYAAVDGQMDVWIQDTNDKDGYMGEWEVDGGYRHGRMP